MNLYDVLCVKPSATQDEIKRNFHKAAHTHHPDKGGDAELFKKISAAYSTLNDPAKRAQYDAQIGIVRHEGGGSFVVNNQNVRDVFSTMQRNMQHGHVSFTWSIKFDDNS